MKNLKLKPFNFEAAMEDATVCTKLGGTATLVSFNPDAGDFPVAGWFTRPNGEVTLEAWTIEGRYFFNRESEYFDLHMLPKIITREGWMNVYPEGATNCNTVYPTKEDADMHADKNMLIDCIKLVYTYEE